MATKKTITYAHAGVDIDEGDRMVDLIKPIVATTKRKEVLGGIGGFAGFFRFPAKKYKDPILVSGTDGVGTKVKVAAALGRFDTVGIDLVAMCVNDILVHGAEPLFFLDYYATGKLKADDGAKVVAGVAEGCRQAGCALLGGETAEMPSVYAKGEFDMAGFAVGGVDRKKLIDGSGVRPGDVVIGLPSSGLHSNGYSLARKIVFETLGKKPSSKVAGWDKSAGETLLTPTRIYVKPVLSLMKKVTIRSLAHITGGGVQGNVPRTLPKGVEAVIDLRSWDVPPVFRTIVEAANLPKDEAYRTFNMGIGMTVVVRPADADATIRHFRRSGIDARVIGDIRRGNDGVRLVG